VVPNNYESTAVSEKRVFISKERIAHAGCAAVGREAAPQRAVPSALPAAIFEHPKASMGSDAVDTMKAMTTRERAEQVLRGLPEEQVPVALEALEAVERDARVLRVLRERHPEKSEQELMGSLKTIRRGREARERIGEAFADVDPEEIEREAVKAVREVRLETCATRRISASSVGSARSCS
jgi:hypothetical protein